MTLPVEIYSSASVRRIDRNAIESARIEGYTLMTRAAQAALTLALRTWPRARRWQVVCGGGNNAGDGYVLARLAAAVGIDVQVVALVPFEQLRGDAALACRDFLGAGGNRIAWNGELDARTDLLVDAILGSGLGRVVEGDFAAAVAAICAHGAPVLALDIPSGLSSDSGEVLGSAVRASWTITFVGLKAGLLLSEAPAFVGELAFADLDIPPSCRASVPVEMRRLSDAAILQALAPRPREAHKGDFGHLLLVGGGPGMAGAVRLGGEAALRCGAGRVSIGTHPGQVASVGAGRPELMCHGIDSGEQLKDLLGRASTIAIGPGLGTGGWAAGLLEAVLATDRPLVVDADALNLLARQPRRRDTWVLTPHPGEAGRLLDEPTGDIQRSRTRAAAELQRRFGGAVVLKGAGTLVATGDGPPWLCTAGNPGMAGPGMGDVLTGVIGALLAQGCSVTEAALAGVQVHARAGDMAAGSDPRGLLASDLFPALRHWVNPGNA